MTISINCLEQANEIPSGIDVVKMYKLFKNFMTPESDFSIFLVILEKPFSIISLVLKTKWLYLFKELTIMASFLQRVKMKRHPFVF